MFRAVLVATALSPSSNRVLGCLPGLRPLGTKQIILVHALGIKHLDQLRYVLAPRVEPHLAAQRAVVEKQGFKTITVIAAGLPAPEVYRLAKLRRASLIVVGSHGSTLARDTLLGGTTVGVLNRATMPVLVIPRRIFEQAKSNRCEGTCGDFRRHLLFCTDFSHTSQRAFAYVERIVQTGSQRVTLLHVQDRARIAKHRLEEFHEIAGSRMERLRNRLKQEGAWTVEIELPYGAPVEEILRAAERDNDTLIVMGTQGRGFIGEFFLGSVSHEVARRTAAPVLIVRGSSETRRRHSAT